ncbi:MAG: orotidine-5'-phosphate decarboxylase [Phycisphaerae bacterium]|nr:orotidine-5'-phosphate decarboxylase [Phycisphaerae bacterium]
MAKNFADNLLEAIAKKRSPVCVGIDPVYARLPAEIIEDPEMNDEADSETALDAVREYCRQIIRIVAPYVPAVKLNIAFFERYYHEGIETYYELIEEAANVNLIVIGDVKRGDIGSTAEMYARSALGDPDFADLDRLVAPDAVTVNGYLGLDGVQPFIDVAREQGKGVFVLVRTTNPSAAEVQDAALADGRTVYELLGQKVEEWAVGEGLVGESGYSSVGAVVGAADRDQAIKLRAMMPHCLFLVPGWGVQGASAENVAACFKSDGTGALVSASRSVIYAYDQEIAGMKYLEMYPSEWAKCVEQACKDFVADVAKVAPSPG